MTLNTRCRKTSNDFFTTYDNKYNITKAEFRLILETFNATLIDSLITEGRVYALPFSLGTVSIRTKAPHAYNPTDYQHFKETGEKRPLRNWHTNEKIAEFVWETRGARWGLGTTYTRLFRLKFSRVAKRMLAKLLKNNTSITKYYERD